MAGLRIPRGSRAGRRSSNSGRLDGDSSMTTASRGSRAASASKTCPAPEWVVRLRAPREAPSGSPSCRPARGRAPSGPARRRLRPPVRGRRARRRSGAPLPDRPSRPRPASPPGRGAPVRTGTAGKPARPPRARRRTARASRAKARPVRRQVTRELRVVVREPGPRTERLLPHGRAELLGDATSASQSAASSAPAPTTIAGRSAPASIATSTSTAAGIRRCRADDRSRRRLVGGILGRSGPIVHAGR